MFNIEELKQQAVSATLATKRKPIPEGDYKAIIKKWDLQEDKNPKINNGEPFVRLQLQWMVDNELLRQQLEREEIIQPHGIILEVENVNGVSRIKTDGDANPELGRLLVATGLQREGETSEWRFSQLQGRVALIKITHKTNAETGDVNANVTKVTALS